MAGGPLFPHSRVAITDNVFPNVHIGAGANSKHDEGLGVANATDLDADATWRLRFQMPPLLPSGVAKLRIVSIANATTGVLRVNPKWVSVAIGEDPSSATLAAEGAQSITWAAGDNDDYKETKITLAADTIVPSEIIAMDLVFEDVSTTLAVVSTHIVTVIWE